jgi:hypothetical protein
LVVEKIHGRHESHGNHGVLTFQNERHKNQSRVFDDNEQIIFFQNNIKERRSSRASSF